MEQRNEKKLVVFKIIAFEPGSTNSYNPKHDTCRWQSICYQATLRFKISLKEVYSKRGSLRVINNIRKVLL